jgi:predicted DNA-binding protein with PD1-like motif
MQARPFEGGWIVRLERGEEVLSVLTGFCAARGVEAGSFTGLGAFQKARLGYFDMTSKRYLERVVEGPFEVLAITGNIAFKSDGSLFAHTHCVLGDRQLHTLGGHLFEAEVGATLELVLRVFDGRLARRPDPDLGLELLDL